MKTKLIGDRNVPELKSRSLLTYPTDGGGSGGENAPYLQPCLCDCGNGFDLDWGTGLSVAINNDEACAAPLSPTCELVACFCLHRPASTLAQLRAARRRHTLIFALVRLQNFQR